MRDLALVVFVLTYAGIAAGRLPFLLVDRTGIALLGATTMLVTGVLTLEQATAAVDVPTILLLYALMVLSSQFRLGGFYTALALRIARHLHRPAAFLLLMMVASAVLSAVLANDVVCLAFTPVLTLAVRRARLNPLPFLLGLAAASNIGSAATIIGNPQNMLIGQLGRLDFGAFAAFCAVPSALALIAAWAVLYLLHRDALSGVPTDEVPPPSAATEEWPPLDRWQSGKALAVTACLVALFFTSVPRELTAMAAAGVLLCSRRLHTRSLLGLVDWHLITLFVALFVVIRGLQVTGVPEQLLGELTQRGLDVRQPLLLSGVSLVLSNLVSNVPAVMLLLQFLDGRDPVPHYVLALASTFAGNLLTIGSIANLITFEQARRQGVTVTFLEHARSGVPITVTSFAILLAWLAAWGA